jgi:hypothetical protein
MVNPRYRRAFLCVGAARLSTKSIDLRYQFTQGLPAPRIATAHNRGHLLGYPKRHLMLKLLMQ